MSSLSDSSILAGGSGVGESVYEINQSIRFNSPDEHLMYSPTPSGSKNFTTTATISMWIKLGEVSQHYLMGAFYGNNNRYNYVQINSSGQLQESHRQGGASTSNGTGETLYKTSQLFRDPAAWYHLIFVYDSTNEVQSDRFRLYVNGERVTDWSTSPNTKLDSGELFFWFGKSSPTTLGAYSSTTGYADYFYFDGYMAEIHGVDGSAYGPEYFGEFNSSNIWIPKEYTGSHGTDGFYIKGENANALGTNSAANGNNFTLNGISSHDQVPDSPTNNFCTGLPTGVGNATGVAFSNGNLTGKTSGTAGNWVSSIPVDSGKWYFEVNNHADGSGNNYGIGQTPDGSYHHFALGSGGNQINDYDIIVNTGSSGSIVGYKLDFDAGTLTHTTNGTSYSSTGSLAAGMAYAAFARLGASSGHVAFNFGQDSTFGGLETAGGNSDSNGIGDFYYNVPSGFLAICTKNLGS